MCRIVLLKYNNVSFIKYKPDMNINNTKGQILRLLFYGHDKKMYCSFKYQPYHLNEPFPINPSHQMMYGSIISSLYYSMNRCVLYRR